MSSDSGINISADDPHLELDKTIQLCGEIKTNVVSIDDLPEEQRNELLGIKPTSSIRVIPASGWFRKW